MAGVNNEFGLPAVQGEEKEEPATFRADDRQAERQAAVPALYKTKHERLACELALGMDATEDVFQRYGYDAEAAATLMESPAFTALLARIGTEIRENGLSFRAKAKAISEELLPYAFDLATDPMTSSAVRADLIKWAAKVAGNEPAPPKAVGEGSAGGFSISLTFAGQAPQQVIAGHTPATIEHNPEGA